MEYILGGICLLVAVTFVGHGLWMLVTSIFGGKPARPQDADSACPRCGSPLVGQACIVCRWPAEVAPSPGVAENALMALRAQVRKFYGLGIFNSTQLQRLEKPLHEERDRLYHAARKPQGAVSDAEVAEEPIVAEAVDASSAQSPRKPPEVAVREWVETHVSRRPRADDVLQDVASETTAVHAAAAAPEVQQPVAPARSWTDWLAAFMEQRNIRWGELVGGMLIVGCSIALVTSFWSEIAARPWLKFGLFNGVTAAIFGIGFYSEHRWRLHTTSQGLLIIGSLLVPLNFLAIAALSSAPGSDGWLTIVGEAVSAVLFAALVFFAGKVVLARDEALLMVGMLVPSLAQLLVRRFVDPTVEMSMLAVITAVPVACYLAVNFWHMRHAARELVPSEARVSEFFNFLGMTSFAVVLPLGLMLYKSGHPIETLRQLPMLGGLLGFVPLSAGLLVWKKLAGRQLAGLRTGAMSVAVFGAVITVGGLVAGWPQPGALVPSAVVAFTVFSFVAWRFQLPAAHLVAAPCLALAYLLGAHLLLGTEGLAWSNASSQVVFETLVSGESGVLLVPLVLAYGGAAFLALRRGGDASLSFAAAAGTLLAASVALVTWFGFGYEGDPLGAGWVYLTYAAGLTVVAARQRHATPAWIGAALLLAGVVQEVAFHYGAVLGLSAPLVTSFLVFSTACAAIGQIARQTRLAIAGSPLVDVAWRAALGASVLAASGLLWLLPAQLALLEATSWLWLAAIWLAAALVLERMPLWTMFQAALVLAVVFAVGALLALERWFLESPLRWLDPWTLEAMAVGLVGLNLCWAAVRLTYQRFAGNERSTSHFARGHRLLASPWLSVDRVTTGVLVVLLVSLGTYAVLPGALVELAPAGGEVVTVADFELPDIPHAHAGGWGAWVLLIGLVGLLAAALRERISTTWLACLLVTTAVACPLFASTFTAQNAAASALRWLSAGFLVLASAAVWGGNGIASLARRLGWPTRTGDATLLHDIAALVLLLGTLAPTLIFLTIGLPAVLQSPQISALAGDFVVPGVFGAVSLLLAAVVWTRSDDGTANGLASARADLPRRFAPLLVVLGALPLVAVGVYYVATGIAAHPIVGPAAQSLFARLGASISYAVPLGITAAVLVGYALRQKAGAFALAGGVTTCLAATTAFLLRGSATTTFDAATWVRLAQLNAVVAAGCAIVWLLLVIWRHHREGSYDAPSLGTPFSFQASIAPALVILLLGIVWMHLVRFPQGRLGGPIVLSQVTDPWGWLSLAAVVAAVAGVAAVSKQRLSMLTINGLLVGSIVMISGVAARWDTGNWLAYHTLFVGHAVIAGLLVAAAWQFGRPRRLSQESPCEAADAPRGAIWTVIQAAVLVLLALREIPHSGWWSSAGLAYVGLAVAPALAWIYQRRRYLYAAVPLVNLAGLLVLAELNWVQGDREFVYWNVVLAAVMVPAWMVIERLAIARRHFAVRFGVPPVHRVVTRAAIAVLVLIVGLALVGDALGHYDAPPDFHLDWIALAATLMAVSACLWDADSRDAVALLYVLGLVACGMLLDGFNLARPRLLWTGTMVLASYAVLTSYFWSRRRGLAQIAARLRIPDRAGSDLAALTWLVPANVLLITSVVVTAFVVEMTEEQAHLRVLASQATLAQVLSLALLARGDHRGRLQLAALGVGAVGAVFFGWVWLEVGTTLTPLHALVVVAAATAGVAALYGLALGKLLPDSSDWLAPARRLTPWLAAVSGAAVAATLSIEIVQYARDGEVLMAWPAIVAIALTLAGLSAAALAAAVLPGRDPLGLSERGRTTYVYGAEVILALLFVHIRVTMPWLFTGFFQQFWPLIVMALAYLGVALAEVFRRRQVLVLSSPLENTGALLPVLPVLGFWIGDTGVDYSLLLLFVGLLYGGLSIARRSFGFGVLAALAANGGLWFFLHRQDGWGFLAHPQVWLIPPAVCVLAAAYLNRKQLADRQMTAVRYTCSMMIYLSSTADIFLNGVAEAPWLPLVLGALSVAGILAGIALRVRAFLFLGTGFLALSVFTIIWYAAVDQHQTWIWWASGIALGIAIVTLFAFFEKKRQDLLDVFERLKQWEA